MINKRFEKFIRSETPKMESSKHKRGYGEHAINNVSEGLLIVRKFKKVKE